jgi:Protein of unknown function (DUF4007)
MLRGPLAKPGFRGHFSGHETFPLRHLWLRKAYDAVTGAKPGRRNLFTDPEAIVTFGVGKNMVTSIRHWALTCSIIEDVGEIYRPTDLGKFLFDLESGRDPFMESPATIWLLQWLIAGSAERSTTWFYAFNHLTALSFDREAVARPIREFCAERGWRTSAATIKRDVECFVRSYVRQQEARPSDDTFEPVLAELGLIRTAGGRHFEFRRGPKPSLPDGVFLYALDEFWQRTAVGQSTLAVERLAYEPGSPGQVFKLDEFSLIERLARIEESSGGRFVWSDTAGVRAVARRSMIPDGLLLLDLAYRPLVGRRAA